MHLLCSPQSSLKEKEQINSIYVEIEELSAELNRK